MSIYNITWYMIAKWEEENARAAMISTLDEDGLNMYTVMNKAKEVIN